MKRYLLILAFLTFGAEARFLRQGYEAVRPTGMGNAFIALADDANCLFYNPAGLAHIKGVHVNLFDLGMAGDNRDSLSRLTNAFFHGDYENLIRQDGQMLGFNVRPSFIFPYFGLSFYNQAFAYLDLQNLQPNAVIEAYGYNDTGVVAGFGIPFGDYFSFGFSVRAVNRTGVDVTTSPQELISNIGISQTDFEDNIYDAIKTQAGTGYGFPLTVGAMMTIPDSSKGGPMIRLAATVEDVGNTTFRSLTSEAAPETLKMSYNFGALLKYTLSRDAVLNVTTDLRRQFEDLPFAKTFHFGTEYRHRYFGIRAGIYQGYATFGASVEFPPHTRLHFSSYSTELGNKLWEREQRWYLLQLAIGFNPL